MATATDPQRETRLKDLAQMVIGAGALALPVAMSKDTWEIAQGLSAGDVAALAFTAVLLIGLFVYAAYFEGHLWAHLPNFFWRVLSIYGLTVIVSSLTLLLVNQAPWLTDAKLALSQTLLVALPAAFAATIVDHMS